MPSPSWSFPMDSVRPCGLGIGGARRAKACPPGVARPSRPSQGGGVDPADPVRRRHRRVPGGGRTAARVRGPRLLTGAQRCLVPGPDRRPPPAGPRARPSAAGASRRRPARLSRVAALSSSAEAARGGCRRGEAGPVGTASSPRASRWPWTHPSTRRNLLPMRLGNICTCVLNDAGGLGQHHVGEVLAGAGDVMGTGAGPREAADAPQRSAASGGRSARSSTPWWGVGARCGRRRRRFAPHARHCERDGGDRELRTAPPAPLPVAEKPRG